MPLTKLAAQRSARLMWPRALAGELGKNYYSGTAEDNIALQKSVMQSITGAGGIVPDSMRGLSLSQVDRFDRGLSPRHTLPHDPKNN